MSRLSLSIVALFLIPLSAFAQEGEDVAPAPIAPTRAEQPAICYSHDGGMSLALIVVIFGIPSVIVFLCWVMRSSTPARSVVRPPFWEDEDFEEGGELRSPPPFGL